MRATARRVRLDQGIDKQRRSRRGVGSGSTGSVQLTRAEQLLELQRFGGNQAVAALMLRSEHTQPPILPSDPSALIDSRGLAGVHGAEQRVQLCPSGCPSSGCANHDDLRRQEQPESPLLLDQVRGKPVSKIRIWIKAFIPGEIPGSTRKVPAGKHAGKTMIPGPSSWLNDCFLTDNRGFSSDELAEARMTSLVELDLSKAAPKITAFDHRCDSTTEVDCEDGDVECSKEGDPSEMHFTNLRVEQGIVKLDVRAEANNPCFTPSPDIDYWGTISIDRSNPAAAKVSFDGAIDAFPNFEMYANGLPLFRRPHPTGNTPGDLFGGAVRKAKGSTVAF